MTLCLDAVGTRESRKAAGAFTAAGFPGTPPGLARRVRAALGRDPDPWTTSPRPASLATISAAAAARPGRLRRFAGKGRVGRLVQQGVGDVLDRDPLSISDAHQVHERSLAIQTLARHQDRHGQDDQAQNVHQDVTAGPLSVLVLHIGIRAAGDDRSARELETGTGQHAGSTQRRHGSCTTTPRCDLA
jgi:hypothetical protein